MAAPSRPDPLAAGKRVAEAARDAATGITQELVTGYRKSNKYLRIRVAVVATWVVLSAITFVGACPSSGPSNRLGAVVGLDLESIMGTQVLVQNESDAVWTEVFLVLDGDWTWQRKTVRPGDKLVVATSQFRKDGAAPPREYRPRTVTIVCEQGKVEATLAAGRVQ